MPKNKFTLIELLVVIGIIGILMAILLPAISGAIKEAKKTEVESQIKQIQIGVKWFHHEYNHYPMVNWPTRTDTDYSITSSQLDVIMQDNNVEVNPDAQNWRDLRVGPFEHPQEKEYIIYFDADYDGEFNGSVRGSVGVQTEFSGEVIKSFDE